MIAGLFHAFSVTRRLPAVASIAFLAACSGGGGAAVAPRAHADVHAKLPATITIAIPHAASGSTAGARRPSYISSATQSATLNVTPQGSTTSVAGFPETVNLTPTSTGCTSTLASTQCAITLSLAPGSYDLTLSTYDQTGGTGNVLSQAQSIPFTIAAGQANSVALTLGGIPASIGIFPQSATLTGSMSTGFTLGPTGPATALVFAIDADSNIIVGSGAPTMSVTSSVPAQVAITEPTASAPNQITLTPNVQIASVTLTATATPASGSGATAMTTTVSVAPLVVPRIYVTSYNGSGTIEAFDPNGNPVALSGSWGGAAAHPLAIGYDSANALLYVAGYNLGISAFDLNGNQQSLSGGFPGLTSPSAIAFNPTNDLLYVGQSSGSPAIAVFDQTGAPHSVSGSFAGASDVSAMAFDSSNGYLYVANESSSTITAYDANGNQQTLSGSFPGLAGPFGIQYDPSNGLLYVSNLDYGTIMVYDQNGNEQTATGGFPNAGEPSGIAYERSNGLLYIADGPDDLVNVYDANGNAQTPSGSGFSNVADPFGIVAVP